MSAEEIRPTWAERELPILRALLRRLDAGEFPVMLEDVRTEIGLSPVQMRAGLRALADASPPYIDVAFTMAGPDHVGGRATSVSERARRELGSWPSPESLVSQLSAALASAASEEPDQEQGNRLRMAASVLSGMARDIAVRVIAARLGAL